MSKPEMNQCGVTCLPSWNDRYSVPESGPNNFACPDIPPTSRLRSAGKAQKTAATWNRPRTETFPICRIQAFQKGQNFRQYFVQARRKIIKNWNLRARFAKRPDTLLKWNCNLSSLVCTTPVCAREKYSTHLLCFWLAGVQNVRISPSSKADWV